MLLVGHVPCSIVFEFEDVIVSLHCSSFAMPTSGNVPVPCAAAADPVVQLPAGSKPVGKLSGAYARQAAWTRVMEHVAQRHGAHVAGPRKSPRSLVGFSSSLPIAAIVTPAATASFSPPKSPPLATQRFSPVSARRSPLVTVPVVSMIKGWRCTSCTYEQAFVPGCGYCIMCNSTRR